MSMRLVCVALAAWGACVAASATDYYVGRGGDDANPGTSKEQAWKTLAPVNAKVFEPGDRILFEAGSRHAGQLKPQGSGAEGQPIAIDRYGEGPLPRFDGEGKVEAAVYLYNVQHWEVQNIEVSNAGYEPGEGRCNGIFLHLKDFGSARHIHLRNLFVRDVSGRGGHGSNSGDGIAWLNEGKTTPSRFDDLRIEGCRIARTHLNGIWGWSEHWIRDPWYPNINVIIRNNLLEDLGMSGIVPIGCDGALVEHNRVVRPSRGGIGIGIWPWSCDNTVIQFNEVSGSDGTHDGQAFDSDWNCRNTVFQYNYSHDNKGGFMLVCTTSLHQYNLGCEGTVVRYNISQNDGGTSTHVIHIAGPCKNTYFYNNTFYTGKHLDVNLIQHGDWEGWATNTYFQNNAVYAEGKLSFFAGESKGNVYANNAWFGNIGDRPAEEGSVVGDPLFVKAGGGETIGDTRRLATLDAYKLQPGSPLVDKGADLRKSLNLDVGTRDYYGNRIPAGAGFDIGAFELVPPDQQPLRILPLGDSITQSDDRHLGYRYHLWKKLVEAGLDFDFVGSMASPSGVGTPDYADFNGQAFDRDHEGHAGWTAGDLVDGCSWELDKGKLSEWFDLYTPDVVLLHIGTNDAFRWVPTEESLAKIEAVIARLQAANPKVTVYLARIIPLGGEWEKDFNPYVVKLNEAIPGLAAAKTTEASRVVVVDHYTDFDGVKDTYDGIHPNESGEVKMAQRWADALLADRKRE